MNREARGQSLVEFALILPIIVLLLVGVFDLGRVVFTNNSLSDGARHGARHAAVDPRSADYCARVDGAVQSAVRGQDLSTYSVTYQMVNAAGTVTGSVELCDGGTSTGAALPLTARPGDRVRVDLGASLTLATPLVDTATGRAPVALAAVSQMQVTFGPAP